MRFTFTEILDTQRCRSTSSALALSCQWRQSQDAPDMDWPLIPSLKTQPLPRAFRAQHDTQLLWQLRASRPMPQKRMQYKTHRDANDVMSSRAPFQSDPNVSGKNSGNSLQHDIGQRRSWPLASRAFRFLLGTYCNRWRAEKIYSELTN